MGTRDKQKENELLVFVSRRESVCGECGEDLGSNAWITLNKQKGAVCMSCADLDHLMFLPSGDMALTVRARKYSTLCAVVLKWSRARKRYERQGIIVEESALARAEEKCLSDADARLRRRERAAERREQLDEQYVHEFAARIRRLFPGCPEGRESSIAEHACLKYSGRVGRTAAAKELEEDMVRLAVIANIRHAETPYDTLLSKGYDRFEARDAVKRKVDEVLATWQRKTNRF